LLSAVIGINVNVTTSIYLPSSPIDTTHFFGHICPMLEFLGGDAHQQTLILSENLFKISIPGEISKHFDS